jgi:predicted DNA-binding transcriptional regulator AlpA
MPARRDPDALSRVLADFPKYPDEAHVRAPVVRALFGDIGSSTLYRWIAAGRVPAPVQLSPRVAGFNVGEIRRALAATRDSK